MSKITIENIPITKPHDLIISDLHWKFAVWSIRKGDNLLVMGDSGFGKTLLAYKLAEVFGRPFFVINLGATQDARSTLIGNVFYNPSVGTFVGESYFTKAIQTENAIILMDEVSRAHPDAQNILLSVLDKNQRYLRIDEKLDTPTVKVAKGVSFIGTANVGSQYSTTRQIDRAFLDRWTTIHMPHLSFADETKLLLTKFPTLHQKQAELIARIANASRLEVNKDNSPIETVISTRITVEMAEMILDGFSIEEIVELKVYPFYSDLGGDESPRTYMRQLVQQFLPVTVHKSFDPFGGANPNKSQTPW